uniref:NTF2 domain-containing protein n=1 Tax=Kalanchoe fedtschenkoi TaxID=63787 RepID=A0A7N0TRK4_KALFE
MSEETEAAAHHLPAADRTANRVADVFLGQYYEVLENHPELAHKFYVDSSVVSRPGADGSMSSVTTLKGIDDLIQSFYAESESDVEVCAADAQYSYGDGLVILVTGFIGSEALRKRFSQMFFLAPQERGYYVLNDVFRYSGEDVRTHVVVEKAAAAEEAESSIVVEEEAENGKKDPESAVVDRKVIAEPKTISGVKVAAIKSTGAKGQPNGKLSYASMVKAATSSAPVAPAPPAAPPSVGSIVKESSNADNIKQPSLPSSEADKKISPPSKAFDQAVEDRSVSVWELPLSIKPYQLDRIFSRKFGPVKQGGIQIRSSQGKNGPLCYAFLEFESAISADTAIKVC